MLLTGVELGRSSSADAVCCVDDDQLDAAKLLLVCLAAHTRVYTRVHNALDCGRTCHCSRHHGKWHYCSGAHAHYARCKACIRTGVMNEMNGSLSLSLLLCLFVRVTGDVQGHSIQWHNGWVSAECNKCPLQL